MAKLKKWVDLIIEKHHNKRSRFFEGAMIVLIMLSVIEVVIESYIGVGHQYSREFKIFEIITVVVFSIEYLMRLWVADIKYSEVSPFQARMKYAFSLMGVIDLVSILPFYIPLLFAFDLRFLRALRVMRLLRILKLGRHSKALRLVGSVINEKKYELFSTFFVAIILIVVSSALMYNLEKDVQPEVFPDIVSTFWWAVETLTTIGYGDAVPVTALGKVVSGIIAVLGIGLVALPTGILSSGFLEKLGKHKKNICCPNCGTEIELEQ